MANKYYRLVTFVVNICPLPLRELLLTKAKSDQKHHFRDLEDYLKFRKPDIDKLGRRCNSDQLAHIYPATGSVDIQSWDVTLLALLLKELFRTELQQEERESLTDITDIRNSLQHIANTEFVDDKTFNSSWKGLEKAVITLAKYAGAPSVKHITESIQSALTQKITHSEDVRHTWYKMLYSDLQSSYLALEKKMDFQTDIMQSVGGKAEKTSTILSKVSVKRLSRSGVCEKRVKIIDNKIEKMRDTLNKALTADNDCKESFRNDIDLINQHLTNNHRVIVTGHDNRLTYKCALAAIQDRNYQRPDQGLEITNPVDWKRISPDDAQFVLFREPFGRTAYDTQKVEVMLEEFDTMLESANADEGENIDIVIVTNQRLLHEVTRRHEHEMLSPVSTFYIDSTAENVQGEAIPMEDTVFYNLHEFSKVYRQSYDRTCIDKSVQSLAEKLFLESSAVTIVGPAKSGKTGLSFNLLQSYDLCNGDENFVVVMDPGELKYVKFSMRPVILLKLFNGTHFDQMEANKWYRQFDRLHAAVLGKKVAVIIIIESENFKKWKTNIPAHHLLDHVVEMPGTHKSEVKKREKGNVDSGSKTEEPNHEIEQRVPDDGKSTVALRSVTSLRKYDHPIDDEFDGICDLCVLPTGEILFIDIEHRILTKIDRDYNVSSRCDLTDNPRDVCYIGDNTAVMAMQERTLQFVNTEELTLTQSVHADHYCTIVACHGNKLYVCDCEVIYAYSTEGNFQKVLSPSDRNMSYRCYSIENIAVSNDGGMIYILVENDGLVTIDNLGNYLYTLNISNEARNLCVDDKGYVYVSQGTEDGFNIIQISPDGRQNFGTLFEPFDFIQSIVFDREKSALIVTDKSDKMKLKFKVLTLR